LTSFYDFYFNALYKYNADMASIKCGKAYFNLFCFIYKLKRL